MYGFEHRIHSQHITRDAVTQLILNLRFHGLGFGDDQLLAKIIVRKFRNIMRIRCYKL
jgi:hypothetical protein